MNARDPSECCPRFDPGPWRDQRLTWHDKLFVKDHVTSFLHIPLNFGAVMRRNGAAIDAADAAPPTMIVLSDEKSLWGADVYLEVTREVPGATMATLSGTFLTKVFEGPYRNIRSWIEQMLQFVRAKNCTLQKLWFYYTTCPKCAKKYGKNYVVLLAQLGDLPDGAAEERSA